MWGMLVRGGGVLALKWAKQSALQNLLPNFKLVLGKVQLGGDFLIRTDLHSRYFETNCIGRLWEASFSFDKIV